MMMLILNVLKTDTSRYCQDGDSGSAEASFIPWSETAVALLLKS